METSGLAFFQIRCNCTVRAHTFAVQMNMMKGSNILRAALELFEGLIYLPKLLLRGKILLWSMLMKVKKSGLKKMVITAFYRERTE